MKKINVLFIIVQMNVMGGSESLVLNLIRNIDRHRYNPSIAWFYGDNPLQEYVELNIPLHNVPKTKSFDFQTRLECFLDTGLMRANPTQLNVCD